MDYIKHKLPLAVPIIALIPLFVIAIFIFDKGLLVKHWIHSQRVSNSKEN